MWKSSNTIDRSIVGRLMIVHDGAINVWPCSGKAQPVRLMHDNDVALVVGICTSSYTRIEYVTAVFSDGFVGDIRYERLVVCG